jgi:hypothetical protein
MKATTPCECAAAGWCSRHRCRKTDHFVSLCATSAEYFALWEAGQGPCIHGGPEDGPPPQQPSRGLGDVVAKIAGALGINKTPSCGCEARQNWLNRLVPFGAK